MAKSNSFTLNDVASLIGYCLITIGAICLSALLAAIPVWFAWNAVIPSIFINLRQITIVDALWLSILCSALFKSSSTNSK